MSKKSDLTQLDPIIIDVLLEFFPNGIVALDLETTGLSPLIDEIIEIAAIKVLPSREVKSFNQLINPRIPIPEVTTKIHGIKDQDVANMPTIDNILPKFIDFIDKTPLVAHNAKFDLGFIIFQVHKHKLLLSSIEHPTPVFCSCTLSRQVFKNKVTNHKLGTLAKELDIQLDNHHRALDDTFASLIIFAKELEELKKKKKDPKISLEKTKLFNLHDFDPKYSFTIPPHLELLREKVAKQEPVEIYYTGGTIKNQFRPVKPVSLLPMPAGNVLYGLCLKTDIYKSFALKKIKEVR